jgi:hypothetical protein
MQVVPSGGGRGQRRRGSRGVSRKLRRRERRAPPGAAAAGPDAGEAQARELPLNPSRRAHIAGILLHEVHHRQLLLLRRRRPVDAVEGQRHRHLMLHLRRHLLHLHLLQHLVRRRRRRRRRQRWPRSALRRQPARARDVDRLHPPVRGLPQAELDGAALPQGTEAVEDDARLVFCFLFRVFRGKK